MVNILNGYLLNIAIVFLIDKSAHYRNLEGQISLWLKSWALLSISLSSTASPALNLFIKKFPIEAMFLMKEKENLKEHEHK